MNKLDTGEEVYQLRIRMGLTRRQFGDLIGMKVGAVYVMERRSETLPRHKKALSALLSGHRDISVGAEAAYERALQALNDLRQFALRRQDGR